MADFFEVHPNDYKFKLDDFEGPLDLLLELIKDKDLDIRDVKISEITDQYMKYIENLDMIDMDKASDFISMAATLLEIKSKNALPKLEETVEEEFDPEEQLRQQLEAYKLFKEKAEELKRQETLNRLYREPEFSDEDARLSIKNFDMEKLLSAYAQLLFKYNATENKDKPKKIQKDRFTVADKIFYVTKLLENKRKVMFTELFDADYSKSEIINTFLALLELLKRQIAAAKQEAWQDDIIIEYKEHDPLEEWEEEEIEEFN